MIRPLILSAALFALAVSSAQAEDDFNALATRALEGWKKIDAVNREMSEATSELQRKSFAIRRLAFQLKKPPAEKKELENLQKEAMQLRERLAEVEQRLELAQVKDPDERKQKAEAYEKEAADLSNEIREKQKPFTQKRFAVQQEYGTVAVDYNKAMKNFFPQPDKKWGVTKVTLSGDPIFGLTSVRWLDENNKQIAWAHVVFGRTEVPENVKLLDNMYPLLTEFSSSRWLRLGVYDVRFTVDKAELKEKATDAVREFVDLKGLSEVKAD